MTAITLNATGRPLSGKTTASRRSAGAGLVKQIAPAPLTEAPALREALPDHHPDRQQEAGRKTALSLRGLKRRFGDKEVLKGIDLDIPEGQFVAIIGKSGCGKSTLLRLITGLDQPSDGSLVVGDGREDKRIRIMFQEPRLLPWARIVENVEVGLTGISKGAAARETALALLSEVGLADRAGEWPAVLSGGQRQRVALARALAAKPAILALDEPLGALDALTRIDMQRLLERIWRQEGFAAVLVTHDVTEAVALADRVIVIDQGAVTLDLPIPLPRPRRHGGAEMAALEGKILAALFDEA